MDAYKAQCADGQWVKPGDTVLAGKNHDRFTVAKIYRLPGGPILEMIEKELRPGVLHQAPALRRARVCIKST